MVHVAFPFAEFDAEYDYETFCMERFYSNKERKANYNKNGIKIYVVNMDKWNEIQDQHRCKKCHRNFIDWNTKRIDFIQTEHERINYHKTFDTVDRFFLKMSSLY